MEIKRENAENMITIENVIQKLKENDYPGIFRKAGRIQEAEAAQELDTFIKSLVEQGVFEEFSKAPDTAPIIQEQIDGLNRALQAIESGEPAPAPKTGCCCGGKQEEAKATLTDINASTRLADILAAYPELKHQMAEINPKFKMLQTPLARVMIPKADITMMSARSGMSIDDLIKAIKQKIGLD